jgi:hypothetical protein
MSDTSSAAIGAAIDLPNPLAIKPRAKTPITPPPPPNPEVFEIMEFCGWARVSRTVAFKEIARGRLKVVKVGRKSLVTLDAARSWLASLPTNQAA